MSGIEADSELADIDIDTAGGGHGGKWFTQDGSERVNSLLKEVQILKSIIKDKDEKIRGLSLHAIDEQKKRMYLMLIFIFMMSIFAAVSLKNPSIYAIEPETISLMSQAVNAIVILMVPFFLGCIGAFARILMSGISSTQNLSLMVASGFMAVFSWVSIKSGVLVSIVAPHLERQGIPGQQIFQVQSGFYTMALVAILVGMFSTNLYIFINQRVEQLTTKKNPKKRVLSE